MGLELYFVLWLILVLSLNYPVLGTWILLTIVATRNNPEIQMKIDELLAKAREWVNEKEREEK